MEIYVRVADDSSYAWYNHTDYEEYLFPGKELEASGAFEDYLRGTPCKSVAEAKRAGRRARELSRFDGYNPSCVEYFRYIAGKLTLTKFTRDNKIKN